jgi:hypothetical protein
VLRFVGWPKAACIVKREQRESPLVHSQSKAFAQQLVTGKDPVEALVSHHERAIDLITELIAALQSGSAVIIEIPQRIGKRSGPTYTVMQKGGLMYD